LGPFPMLKDVCCLSAADVRDADELDCLRVVLLGDVYHVVQGASGETVREFLRRCASVHRRELGLLMDVFGVAPFGVERVDWSLSVGAEEPPAMSAAPTNRELTTLATQVHTAAFAGEVDEVYSLGGISDGEKVHLTQTATFVTVEGGSVRIKCEDVGMIAISRDDEVRIGNVTLLRGRSRLVIFHREMEMSTTAHSLFVVTFNLEDYEKLCELRGLMWLRNPTQFFAYVREASVVLRLAWQPDVDEQPRSTVVNDEGFVKTSFLESGVQRCASPPGISLESLENFVVDKAYSIDSGTVIIASTVGELRAVEVTVSAEVLMHEVCHKREPQAVDPDSFPNARFF